jgi:hypothetical protein
MIAAKEPEGASPIAPLGAVLALGMEEAPEAAGVEEPALLTERGAVPEAETPVCVRVPLCMTTVSI